MTPTVIALVIIAVLITVGFAAVSGRIRHARRDTKPTIFKIERDAPGIAAILASVRAPASVEIAVNQIGRSPQYCVALPAARSAVLKKQFGAREIDDYDLYYPGGVHLGAYARGEVSLAEVGPDTVDFSAINEVGEGAVLQITLGRRRGGAVEANVRVLVSAPSAFQAKEILSGIKASLPGVSFVDVKNDAFLAKVNGREFDEKESVGLTL